VPHSSVRQSHVAGPVASPTRGALAGFSLSGFLAALLGAILPAWGFHLNFEFLTAGHYFLSVTAGVLGASLLSRRLRRLEDVSLPLLTGCGLACGALLFLAAGAPPAPDWWRMAGLFVLGLALGVLNASLFYAISPAYQFDPAATVNIGGVFFGLGCLTVTLLVAGTFYAYSVGVILALASFIPAAFAWIYARARFTVETPEGGPTLQDAMRDIRNPAAILLALLLFFQFGNEWTLAGWLAVFLVSRLGISPESSLRLLAVYWIALLLGRVAAVALLPRLPHGRLLLGSAAAALFGCVILLSTNNLFGAYAAVLLSGAGFASIYPLTAEMIGHRFAYYHPGLFNGIFSFAMVGAMLAPATAGYLAHFFGVATVMVVPLVGTVMVVLLLLLIWLESKIGG
jgi:fucose permease